MRATHHPPSRRRERDLLPALLAPAALAILITACGPEGSPTPPPAAGPPTAAAGQPPEPVGAGVRVMGIWGGDELESFEAMVAPWQDETGHTVQFTGSRNITADLTIAGEAGDPPAVAIPAEIGLFREFAAGGQLVPLSACAGLEAEVRANYPPGFVELGAVDGRLYGFFMKADTKATIWYDPAVFGAAGFSPLGADATWDDLVALSEQIAATGLPPWSMGLESAEASGWPASDWIQQILLNEAGPEVYDGIVAGTVPYTDPAVKDAWEKFGRIALADGFVAQGSANGINATNFQDASYPPFESPPAAAMTYLGGFAGGFIQDQFPDAQPGVDYDFFPFPGGAVTGGANIVYAFDDDPATCSLLSWLASADAQRIWVDRGGFTALNGRVDLDAYPNAVARAQAEQLATAETFRFDLDDAIGGAFQQALFQGLTGYLTDPGRLDAILAGIEASR